MKWVQLWVVWTSLSIALLWDWKCCVHCWVFQICRHIVCSTLIASSFRTWNSSTEIPSPPLALSIVMIPKAHLTSHSKMSGSRWLTIPLWLSGSLRPFLVWFFCNLFLISYASVWSWSFLSFIVPIFAWNAPLVSLISKRFLVFLILLFSSVSLHCSLKKAFLSLLAILCNSYLLHHQPIRRMQASHCVDPLPVRPLPIPQVRGHSSWGFSILCSLFPWQRNKVTLSS